MRIDRCEAQGSRCKEKEGIWQQAAQERPDQQVELAKSRFAGASEIPRSEAYGAKKIKQREGE
jgi:hypothetical protein